MRRQLARAPSSIATDSSAGSMYTSAAAGSLASSGRSWPGLPVRAIRTPSSRAALIAPATISPGAWSPPMASTAIIRRGAGQGSRSSTCAYSSSASPPVGRSGSGAALADRLRALSGCCTAWRLASHCAGPGEGRESRSRPSASTEDSPISMRKPAEKQSTPVNGWVTRDKTGNHGVGRQPAWELTQGAAMRRRREGVE